MTELDSYSSFIARKPMLVAGNKIDLISEDNEKYLEFKAYVEGKGYEFYPISAATNKGVKELLYGALRALRDAEENYEEPEYEIFDFEKDEALDEEYRKVYARKENDIYILEGQQLSKIFNSTNFNDMGSLRYLFKYIENSGAMKELKDMGLQEGDTVKIEDFEFEYFEEF